MCDHVILPCSSRSKWAGQEGTSAFALPAFKVAVAGADRILAGLDFVAVHGNAHAAASFPPFCAGFAEDAVQAFGFSLVFDLLRARHDQRTNTRGDFPIFEDVGSLRRSDSRPLVQLPMKTTSTGCPINVWPGVSPM